MMDSINQDDKQAWIDRTKYFIKGKFPKVDFAKISPIGFSEKSGNEKTTEIKKKNRSGLLKKFTDKFKTSLGREAESLIAQDNEKKNKRNPSKFKRRRKATRPNASKD